MMEDGLKKEDEKRNRELIHKLLDLVLDINGLEPRERKLTGELPTAFLELQGHIASVNVDVHKSGWYGRANVDKSVEGHTYRAKELESAVRELEAIKAETPTAGTAGESR